MGSQSDCDETGACHEAEAASQVEGAAVLPLSSLRAFGTKRVRQRRRSRGRILQKKETHYEPKPEAGIPTSGDLSQCTFVINYIYY